jgi:hypothetical protein
MHHTPVLLQSRLTIPAQVPVVFYQNKDCTGPILAEMSSTPCVASPAAGGGFIKLECVSQSAVKLVAFAGGDPTCIQALSSVNLAGGCNQFGSNGYLYVQPQYCQPSSAWSLKVNALLIVLVAMIL